MDWSKFRLSQRLSLDTKIIEEVYSLLSKIDAVKTSWKITGGLLPQSLERLSHSVIVTSSGASNRIEGNLLTDEQVRDLYRNLRIRKFNTRDEQEVAGYLEMLESIFEHYKKMPIGENTVLQIHRDMLKYSHQDERHRGVYKFGSNRVEAKDQDGNVVGVIFDPTPPHLVKKEIQELVQWYAWASAGEFKHPLILIANFIFEYLAIHPFQDGNGRTSRLLTNIMLLQNEYEFASLVSHEKLVEANKADYYLALNKTQRSWKTEHEDISAWLLFFLRTMENQAAKGLEILQGDNVDYLLSEKQLRLLQWARKFTQNEFGRKDAIEALGMPARTVEASIKKLLNLNILEKLGQGRATRYRLFSQGRSKNLKT
jgi:Fic family protein